MSELTTACKNVKKIEYYKSYFVSDKMDNTYPPVARAIMWAHSFLKSQLIEDLNAFRVLDLP